MTLPSALVLGLGLGLAAGASPGPLMTLVVAATLRRGLGAGARVAVAPLVTDLPIIVLCVTVLASLPAGMLTGLTTAGALLVAWLGVRTLAESRRAATPGAVPAGPAPGRRDLWEGVLVNFLSPHPWLFWIAVGGPILLRAWQVSPPGGVAFVTAFYAVLVGSKLVLAWLVAHGRERLASHWQRRVLAACGLLLLVFAGLLLWDAWGAGGATPGPATG